MAIGSASLFFPSCKVKSMEGMIILTRTAATIHNSNDLPCDSRINLPQSQIVALNPEKPGMEVKVLTSDFWSAFSPSISDDCRLMLFAARQKQNDSCQIYEMDLANLKFRQITAFKEGCINPAYLPDGRLIFSKRSLNNTPDDSESLYTCNADGSDIKRITFNRNAFFGSTVLKDGRILTISQQFYPEKQDPEIFVLRPDGTKAGLFYKGNAGCTFLGRGCETNNGRIVFVECEKSGQNKGNIISISYNRPMHSEINLTSDIKGDFKSVYPLSTGSYLVILKQSEAERYSLYEFDPGKKALGRSLYTGKEYDVYDPVMVEKHERPKKLPSEVDLGVKTGLILCQDVNIPVRASVSGTSYLPKASRIELMGMDSTLGVVKAEEDGSFYLKVVADTPFQIRTIDEKGNVLQGPCGWIWLRPNERRGCVGCHEDPEMAPDNKVPQSVKKPPVNIPVHVNKIVEKKVSLE
jgi:hypothetical protein